MKKILTVIMGFATLLIYPPLEAQSKNSASITIQNNSSIALIDKVIEINWDIVTAKLGSLDTSQLIVQDAVTKKQLVFQLTTNGSATIQQLLIQLSLLPKQSKTILLGYGKRIVFTSKTYGRYVPERKDDFAWENDKIAFRMYGKALENTPKEMAYGSDVWVKRTSRLILNERYKLAEYHIDHGDGMDYYHVGLTLGAGSMMPYIDDSIYYSRNYVDYKVLDNGPLRTSFQLLYDEWQLGNKKVKAVKTIALDAGSQFNRIVVKYTSSGEALPVTAGIITRKGAGVKYLDESGGSMVYWEPQHGEDGITGVACIFTTPVENMIEMKGQLLAKTITNDRHEITYYAGAAWNKAGIFKNGSDWIKHVQEFQQYLKNSVMVK